MKYAFLFIFTKVAFGCDNDILDVNRAKDISAKVLLKDNDSLEVSVSEAGKQVNQENVDVSSEEKNHITFEDYNRNGYKDFGIWHLDEGVGTYKIYRLFIFSPADKKFKEIKPTCGDDFVNVRIEGHNMIYDNNTPKSCSIPSKVLNNCIRYVREMELKKYLIEELYQLSKPGGKLNFIVIRASM